MSVSATYYHRRTRDIFEDFDPGIYTVPAAYGGDINAPNSLFLGWEYFGWTAANHPAANFFLGTLPGGKRDYNGVELVLRKRFSEPVAGPLLLQLPPGRRATRCRTATPTSRATCSGSIRARPNMYGTSRARSTTC